jgi:very-short-patch-repair endonuclease
LREAELSELDLVPALRVTAIKLDYEGLRDRISEIEADVRRLQEGERRCAGCVDFLIDRAISPERLTEIVAKVKFVMRARGPLDSNSAVGELIGSQFEGAKTSCENLQAVLAWSGPAKPFAGLFRTVSSAADLSDARTRIEIVLHRQDGYSKTLAMLNQLAKVNFSEFSGSAALMEAADEFDRAALDPEGLLAHATLRDVLNEVEPHGVMPLVRHQMHAGRGLEGLAGQCEALAVRQLAKSVFTGLGKNLTKFRGAKLDEFRSELAELDREIIRLSRKRLRAQLKSTANPPAGNGVGKKSSWTQMALLDNEVSKKQRFLPVRDLTQRAGRALLELKPCWMMSPLAVAQYVPKGSVHFDLCIIDEASQMPPESGLGALLRSEQTMVVGDTNQLPPTNFFKTVIDDEEADEDEAVLNESILEMANATFRPARRLRWHYRSRHSGLIKFSNRLVYDDDLIVFPSATEAMARMGVEYRSVDGRYKAGTNPTEAQAVIDAAVEFMRTDPDRSLGIVTLNQKQRDLILEEFEFATARHGHVQKYIEEWRERNDGLEEFFIKNLENVQGDERDVIFIGTVYGPEEPGARVMQRFGPINGLAGKRRLNVLFTRAKEKIVTFSSMTTADIEADEHGNPGAYMLKRWLEYSATGVLDGGEQTLREPDSDFEIFVIDQIRAMGCTPVPQVGVAGYFIDIGIRHPGWPHGYLLGVECDGATYHSAKSARDRDRLRQQVLEDLGWKLHRIWSTDWFNDPRKEADRLRTVIAATLAEFKLRVSEFDGGMKATRSSVPEPIQVPASVIRSEPQEVDEQKSSIIVPLAAVKDKSVEIGDTVRVRYLSDDKKTVRITISKTLSDPDNGVIHFETPIAKALLGAEEGDEVDVLVGSYVRPAIVESISKNAN